MDSKLNLNKQLGPKAIAERGEWVPENRKLTARMRNSSSPDVILVLCLLFCLCLSASQREIMKTGYTRILFLISFYLYVRYHLTILTECSGSVTQLQEGRESLAVSHGFQLWFPHFYFCDASPVTSSLWASVSSFVKMKVVTIMKRNYCKDTITYVKYRWYIIISH